MKKRKVAVVAFSAPPYSAGGVAAAHFNLFRALYRSGLDAQLFTFGDPGRKDTRNITRRGTPPWFVNFLNKLNRLLFGLLEPGKKAFQARDIFISQLGALRMGRAISTFSPDVIVLSDHGAPGLMLKPGKARTILVTHHNPARFTGRLFADFSKLDARWAISLEQRVLQKVNAIVCPSRYMKSWFEKTYRFDGPRLIIPNVLEAHTLTSVGTKDLRDRMGLSSKHVLIYMPSAGTRLKGSEYLPQILSRLSEKSNAIAFYIPGAVTPERKKEFSSINSRVPIFFTGQIPYKTNIAQMKSCSFGISPSLMENYSMALLEAVWCGVPMLAFDTGGNSEIIHQGQNGYLFPEGDVVSLIERAQSLLDAAVLKRLRNRTRAFAEKQKATTKPLDAYLELIKTL